MPRSVSILVNRIDGSTPGILKYKTHIGLTTIPACCLELFQDKTWKSILVFQYRFGERQDRNLLSQQRSYFSFPNGRNKRQVLSGIYKF